MTRKRYFYYHFKKNLFYLLSVSAIAILIVFTTSTNTLSDYNLDTHEYTRYVAPDLDSTCWFLFLLSILTPILELSMFKKRKDLDSLFSLPISRRDMLGVNFFTGLLINAIVFTLSVVTLFLSIISSHAQYESLLPLILLWFGGLIIGTITYSLFAFLFYEGNTIVDGILFIINSLYVLPLLFNSFKPTAWSPLSTLSPCTLFRYFSSWLEKLIVPSEYYFWVKAEDASVCFGFFALAGIASLLGFFLFSHRKPVNRVGEVSESFFGYRTFLPVLLLSLFLQFFVSLPLLILAIVIVFVGYLIYRRGFHFKIEDAIVSGSVLLLGFILHLLTIK